MARRTRGRVVETRTRKGTTYAAQFQASGKRHYLTFGSTSEGWDRKQAEAVLRHTLADVERGTWQPPRREPMPDVDRDPSFHVFASEWYDQREAGWRVKTRKDYEWKLSKHLLKTFGSYRLSQIGPAEVDRFRDTKLRQGTLSPGQVNKVIGLGANPRGRSRVRIPRAQPREGPKPTREGHEAGAGMARLGRTHRRSAGRGRRA